MRISGRVYNNRLPVPGPLLPSRGLSSGDVCANCEAPRFETRSPPLPPHLPHLPLRAQPPICFSLFLRIRAFIENMPPSRICSVFTADQNFYLISFFVARNNLQNCLLAATCIELKLLLRDNNRVMDNAKKCFLPPYMQE